MEKYQIQDDKSFKEMLETFEGIVVALPKHFIGDDGYENEITSAADFYIVGKKWEGEEITYNIMGYNEEDGCTNGFSSCDVPKSNIDVAWFWNHTIYKFKSLPEFCEWYLTREGYEVNKKRTKITVSTYKKISEIPYYKKEALKFDTFDEDKEVEHNKTNGYHSDISGSNPHNIKQKKKITRREKYEDIIKIIDLNTEFILTRMSDDPSKCLSIYGSLQEFLEGEVEE